MLDFENIDISYRPKVRYWIPGGMTKGEDLRKDVRDFYERGFGSIEVVSFTLFGVNSPEGYRWGEENYIQGLLAILDEARKYNMKVDIANGPAWPIAMPTIHSCEDLGAMYEITYGVGNTQELPERRVKHEEGESTLLALYMYKEIEDHVLDENSYIDLMPYLKGKHIDYYIPSNGRVFAFYSQPACQKVTGYYVIDHFSEEGTKKCEEFWLNTLYPRIKEYDDVLENIFCDSLEYKVAGDWTIGFEMKFWNKFHYQILPYMCVIGTDLTYPKNDVPHYHFRDTTLEMMVNKDYYAMLTDLYANNHLAKLEEMANKMNMHVRYQVAYNKTFEISQCAASVGIPENEALSRCSIDNLKSMGGGVHLSHKKIYSYECSAEFENAYGQTFEDILWWIKRSYVGGMNYQVFHGGTYNGGYEGIGNVEGHIPSTTTPGYEAFGRFCSNYWNRTLDKESERYHLETISRYNYILQKDHLVELAIYRNEYLNNGKGGDGTHIVKDNSLLFKNGYDYDFISYHSIVDKHLSDLQSIGYQALLILPDTYLMHEEEVKINDLQREGLKVYTLDPYYSQYQYIEDYSSLVELLKKENTPVTYNKEQLIYHIHTKDENNEFYYFYNGNAVEFGLFKDINPKKEIFHPDTIYPTIQDVFSEQTMDITIHSDLYPVIMLDNGKLAKIPFERENGIHIKMNLAKDEAVMICLADKEEYNAIDLVDYKHLPSTYVKEIHFEQSSYQFVFDGYYFDESHYEQKEEITAGYYLYTTDLNCEKGIYSLDFDHIYDTYILEVDGNRQYNICEYHPSILMNLEEGNHHIVLKVYTNLAKMLVKDQKYGILGKCNLKRIQF